MRMIDEKFLLLLNKLKRQYRTQVAIADVIGVSATHMGRLFRSQPGDVIQEETYQKFAPYYKMLDANDLESIGKSSANKGRQMIHTCALTGLPKCPLLDYCDYAQIIVKEIGKLSEDQTFDCLTAIRMIKKGKKLVEDIAPLEEGNSKKGVMAS